MMTEGYVYLLLHLEPVVGETRYKAGHAFDPRQRRRQIQAASKLQEIHRIWTDNKAWTESWWKIRFSRWWRHGEYYALPPEQQDQRDRLLTPAKPSAPEKSLFDLINVR